MSIKTHHTHIHTLAQNSPRTSALHSRSENKIHRFPPITHQGQHDLITISDLLPDIPPFPRHPALHALALAHPDLRAFNTLCSLCLDMALLAPVATGLAFSPQTGFCSNDTHSERRSQPTKNLKMGSPGTLSIFQSLPWLYFHREDSLLSENVLYEFSLIV